jgi:hypothetical protein
MPASGTMTPAVDPHIVEINVESVLFDMDGTLINSSPAVVKAWQIFAETYPLDLDDILRCKCITAFQIRGKTDS